MSTEHCDDTLLCDPENNVCGCKVVRLKTENLNHQPPRTKQNPNVGPAPTIDMRNKMPAVYDQGSLGSCTANALCGAFAYAVKGFLGSRLFLYYNTRVIANNVPYDAGAYVHDGITALKTYGLCSEGGWPYNIRQFAVKPPSMCYKAGSLNKVLTAYNVPTTLGAMKACLAGGVPFVLGFIVYSSFQSLAVARTGIVPMPGTRESIVGGHAVLVCGYNDSNQRFIVRNSWGAGWGDRGYFYMPYAYFTNPSLTSDVWAITSAR